jgi:hypothetical protein
VRLRNFFVAGTLQETVGILDWGAAARVAKSN